MDQVKQDVERCLPKAQALFQQLVNAPHPQDYARAYQDAFDKSAAEDIWAAVLLPAKIAQVFIAEHLTHGFPEIDFTYALRAAFGVRPHQTLVNLPMEYITAVTQKSEADLTKLLTSAGFEVADGKVARHESQDAGFVENMPHLRRNSPRPPSA